MARIKVVFRKKPRVKVKSEFRNPLVPRLRLEPRLNSNLTIQINKSNENINNKLYLKLPETSKNSNVNNFGITGNHIGIEGISNETSVKSTEHVDEEHEKEFYNMRKYKKIFGSRSWSDIDIMNFSTALQMYGFGEPKKIADFMKTKDEYAVKAHIKTCCTNLRKEKRDAQVGRPQNTWNRPHKDDLDSWPAVRKWRKMAFNQMLALTRSKEYSHPLISSMCSRFYEEAEEYSDPQVIDVKAIYKFLLDCVNGHVPALLPPKESALVLQLIKEAKSMSEQYDFSEEKKFLESYKAATKFKPFHIKDEFTKRFKKESSVVDEPGAVSVPEQVFMDLSRHKRLVQSFNPLMTPLWMIQKEQEYFENYFKKLYSEE